MTSSFIASGGARRLAAVLTATLALVGTVAEARDLAADCRDPDRRQRVSTPAMEHGQALLDQGERTGSLALYRQALTEFEAVQATISRRQNPYLWASTEYARGVALIQLASREPSLEALEQAELAFRGVLSELPADRCPSENADSRAQLGSVLSALSVSKQAPELLDEAVSYLQEALAAQKPSAGPASWSRTQNRLADALVSSRSSVNAEEAIRLYRENLAVIDRTKAPQEWRRAKGGLATALSELARMRGDMPLLDEAITKRRESLATYTPDSDPHAWAAEQSLLAMDLLIKGQESKDIASLRKARESLVLSIDVLTRIERTDDANTMRSNLDLIDDKIAALKP